MFSSHKESLGYKFFEGVVWALVLGLRSGNAIEGLLLVLGSPCWACVRGQPVLLGLLISLLLNMLLGLVFFKPNQLPPSPWLQ